MDFTVILLMVLILLVAAGFALVFSYFSRKFESLSSVLKADEILQRLERHKGELGANLKSLDDRLHAVTTEIGGVKEVTGQLREFQASLKSQKLRGNVGELVLEDLLHQVLPSATFEMQHTFRNGKRVDALVKTRQGTIPIDSKFPVEDFQKCVAAKDDGEKERCLKVLVRNVKGRMDEAAEYILPEEGTVPFALMYIPFEPIFQEVVADGELMRYTLDKKVFFTSPQTFLITMRAVLLGLEREKFSEQAEEIMKTLHAVTKDAAEFERLLTTAAMQLTNAKVNLDKLVGSFSTLLGKLEKLHDVEARPKQEA